jgi:type II secretory pathway pseudopilin PulG
VAILAVLMALAAPSASPAPDGTISRAEVQAMSSAALAQRLFGDMSAILLPLSLEDQTSYRPDRPLRRLVFRTVGRGTYYSGICRSDELIVEFENAGPNQGAQTRVRPRAISTGTQFYVLDATALSSVSLETREAREAEHVACRAISPRQSHLIYARDDMTMSGALRALHQARGRAQSRTLAAPDCVGTGLRVPACSAMLAGTRVDQVESIDLCQSAQAYPCYEIQVDAPPPLNWQFGAMIRIETDEARRVTRVSIRRIPESPSLVMVEEED